jgi:hypothetical protein
LPHDLDIFSLRYFVDPDMKRLGDRHLMLFFLVVAIGFTSRRTHEKRAGRYLGKFHSKRIRDNFRVCGAHAHQA